MVELREVKYSFFVPPQVSHFRETDAHMTPTVSEGVPSSPALDTLAWSSAGVLLVGTRGPRSDAGSGYSLSFCISRAVYGHVDAAGHPNMLGAPKL